MSTNPGATRILRAPLAAYRRPAAGRGARPGRVRAERAAAVRRLRGRAHAARARPLAARLRAARRAATAWPQDAINIVARGAELPERRAAAGVRRHLRDRVGPARAGLGRGGAPPGARDQEPADADPALGRAAADEARRARSRRPSRRCSTKSVKTIVDQVDAMKRLVNEFRDYARLPAAELKPVDLNALVADVLQPLRRGAGRRGALRCRAGRALPADPSATRSSCARSSTTWCRTRRTRPRPTQRRRAACEVVIRTRLRRDGEPARAPDRAGHGPGFAENILKRAFEPYVTTKTKGTGLGLAVVKKIADEHGARIELSNRIVDGAVAGAQVSLSFALAASRRERSLTPKIRSLHRLSARACARTGKRARRYQTRRTTKHSWQTSSWSTTNWASGTCSSKSSMTKATTSNWRRTRPQARAARAARPARPGAARHLDARHRRRHAAQGVVHRRPAEHAGDHDERPRHHRHRGRGHQASAPSPSSKSRSRCRSC